jgi:hypothetical protein
MMTYGRCKSLASALLAGDNKLTKNDDELLGLLEYAFHFVGSKAEALHLLTMNRTDNINRKAAGDWLSRFPELPADDEDELDIDHELCFAVARYIAASISKNKPQVHENEAMKIINDYNSKVSEILADAIVTEGGDCDC